MKHMQSLPQWVNWRLEMRDGNPTKVPYKHNGTPASNKNKAHWSTFDECAAVAHKFSGVGFVLTDDDGYVFIDLDHVLDENRKFKPGREWAEDIVDTFDTYWEVSPSGDGLHGFVKYEDMPDDYRHKVYFNNKESALEVYHKGRYSTITTDLFMDNHEIAEVDSDDMEALFKHIIVNNEIQRGTVLPQIESGSVLSDDEVVERMDAAGHWLVGVGQDGNSELDASFISHLAFWCGGDEQQIERLALQNPLKRDKWFRKQSGGTFLQYQIKAWKNSGKAEYYIPPERTVFDVPFSDLTKEQKKQIVKEETKNSIKEGKKKKKLKQVMEWLGDNQHHIWFDIETEKYGIRTDFNTLIMSKSGFLQYIQSHTGVLLGKDDLEMKALYSDYRPDRGLFFQNHGHDYINTFTATDLMNVSAGATEIPNMISKLLNNLFDDKDQMEHFINWLACIYQKRVRTKTAWIFAGKQGTGKGILVDYIIKGIWKHHSVCNLTDSNLSSQFNPYLQNKMIVHFNEISADTKKSRVEVKNRLKTWMTDETIFINSKGVKEFEQSNYCNLIMNSNEHIPVDIDTGDRRFNVVRTDNVLVQQDWFVLGDSVNAMVDEIEEFASYLAGYKIDCKKASTVINSAFKDELVDAVKSMPERIADAIQMCDFDFFIDCNLEGWIDKFDGFHKSLSEIRYEFESEFISNKTLTLLISAAFQKETTANYFSRGIIKRYKVGSPSVKDNQRGVLKTAKKVEITF